MGMMEGAVETKDRQVPVVSCQFQGTLLGVRSRGPFELTTDT
jgi:hypothetical protein